MEDLNKHQFILLTLLVSFVTSIATGIITVSLLQEAPLEVTRTINQVVEKTIETVTPGAVTTPKQPETTTTVVVSEEDQVLSSINKNINSIVRIKEADPNAGTTEFYGIGLVISKDGLIGADRKAVTVQNTYTGVMNDGTEMPLIPVGLDKDTNFILFKATQATSTVATTTKAYAFSPAIFGSGNPQLGQTLIGLGGQSKNSVSVGRVTSLEMKDSGTGTSTTSVLADINTDIATKDLVDGSPVFNLSGDLIGVKLESDDAGSFTPIAVLKKEIGTLTEPPKTP